MLEKGFGRLPDDDQERLEYIIDNIGVDSYSDKTSADRIGYWLEDWSSWLSEIYPDKPDKDDRKAMSRYRQTLRKAWAMTLILEKKEKKYLETVKNDC